MEALSPRSTNQKIKPKESMERKLLDKKAVAAGQKPPATKDHHAQPPPAIVTEPEEDAERYSTGAFLGKGGFAICYEGRLLRNGRVFAMKVVKAEMKQKKMEEKFQTELQIHSKMRHPHIVRFHRAFTFHRSIYVILELCPNGSVMDMVKKRKSLSLPEVRRIMIQLCGAVKYLHKRHVAHRDLKMGNLFLDHNMDIKVGDFGLAAMIMSEKDEKRRTTLCGTPNYIAPEILDKTKRGHTQKVDIWSLGVICFAMLTGYPPFQSKTQEEIYKKVRNLVYVWPKASECGNEIPDEAKSLVESCLNLEEDQRPEPDDIVEHRFFDMYDGCIPGRLEPSCCHTKPLWLRNLEPRGDYMMRGYSLEYDERLLGYIDHVDDPIQRYRVCKAAFYALSGVGRKPDGTARRASGKNCNKTAYAECAVEEERGLNPVIPLPDNFVYKYPHDPDGDWSLPESVLPSRKDDSSLESSSVLSGSRTASVRGNASQSRTQAALLAAQQRRKESQSHAATLRQQASSGRGDGRKLPAIFDPPAPSEQPIPEVKAAEPEAEPKSTAPAGGLAERPVRPRRGVAASYSGSVRGREMDAAPQMTKSSSIPGMLTVGKTRSQSKRLEATTDQGMSRPTSAAQERVPSGATEAIQRRRQPPPSRPMSIMEEREPLRESKPRSTQAPARDEQPENERRQKSEEGPGLSRSGSTNSSSTNKPRSSLGANPLFHSQDPYEVVPRTAVSEVNTDLRLMFSHLSAESPARRRAGPRREPHPYVIKWVDYTNRYGIGYVLDDGSVGCVFKAENGQPASSVVLRAGEKHIRRKARSHETRTYNYSEMDQFIPRNGQPVEFYENCDNDPAVPRSAVRRAFISPSVFEVKRCQGAGIKLRHDLHGERAPADYEKIKRVKLVDQFGKYMIGSLGRHGHEGLTDEGLANRNDGQFIKFYQRLGNVGVWGFGDGAFQFNFPDHTKLVIAPGMTRSSSPWIDFYHLSPSAARYLATRGKMHPSGFDTRAVASDEAATFMSIALGKLTSSVDAQIGEVLAANSFLKKIQFLKDVFAGWISKGRLGGRPSPSRAPFSEDGSGPLEMFWEGSQEHPQGGNGGKFVWVTVGAPGGDGDYRSVSLQKEKRVEKEGDEVVETLRKRLQCLGEST